MRWEKAADLAARMFNIDDSLSRFAANRNHNLACFLGKVGRYQNQPSQMERLVKRFDVSHWQERMQPALIEINSLDPSLAKEIEAFLDGF